MNRGRKYRKTIAYCMIWLLLLQLLPGERMVATQAADVQQIAQITITAQNEYTPDNCTKINGEDVWELSYEIDHLGEGNPVYLTVKQTTDGSNVLLTDKELLTGTDLEWDTEGRSDSVAVHFQDGASDKATLILKKPQTECDYEIAIEVKDHTGVQVTKETKNIHFGKAIAPPDIVLRNVDAVVAGSVVDSVADGTWTNKDVAFDVEVKDGTTGLVKVTYELDGQPVDSPQTWDAAAPEKNAVTKQFSFDTSAASSQGHVLKVTAENAKGKDATLTKYILIDKGKPAISLHVKGDETKTVENTVYKAPFEIEAAVTDDLPTDMVSVQYMVNGISDSNKQNVRTFDAGQYVVSAIATDAAGNSTESAEVTFQVDGAAPTVTKISSQSDGGYYRSKQTFQYQVDDDCLNGGKTTLTVKRTIDGISTLDPKTVSLSDTENTVTYDCEEEGLYEFTITAEDAVGNTLQEPYTFRFTIDKKAPTISIDASDKNGTGLANEGMTRQGVNISLQITDRNPDLSGYSIVTERTDGDGHKTTVTRYGTQIAWNTEGDPAKCEEIRKSVELPYEEEGYYTVTFSAKDRAGNDNSKKFSFYIDRSAPVINENDIAYRSNGISLSLKYGMIFSNRAIQVTFPVRDSISGLLYDGNAGAVYVTIGTKDQKAPDSMIYPADRIGNSEYYSVMLPLKKVKQFDNQITIWAKDQLLNEGYAESKRTIYNENLPVVAMEWADSNTAKEGDWSDRDVVYHTVVEDTFCGIRKITYKKIENGQEQIVKTVDFTSLENQQTEFVKRQEYDFVASDSATTTDGYELKIEVENNCGSTQEMSRMVYVDKEPPKVELSGVQNGKHYNQNQTIHTRVTDVSYKGTANGTRQSAVTTYHVTRMYDGKTETLFWRDMISDHMTSERDDVIAEEGTYEIYAKTVDCAGNTTTSDTIRFTIDKYAPVIEKVHVMKEPSGEQTPNADGIYYLNRNGRYIVEASDHFPSDDAHIDVAFDYAGVQANTESYVLNVSPLRTTAQYRFTTEGKYRATVTGTDKAGNIATPVQTDIVVDKTSPKLSICGMQSGTMTKNPVTLTYEATDKNHDFDEYQVTVHRTTLDGENETIVEKEAVSWKQEGYDKNAQVDYTTQKTSVYSKEGNYTITFEGTDRAGNVATARTVTFSIDHTAPAISNVQYWNENSLLQPRYSIIFSNKMIRVQFQVTDRVTGVQDDLVYVTLGTAAERAENTPLYIARKGKDSNYYIYVPQDVLLTEYDGVISIWANDRLKNESNVQSVRMIQNTDHAVIVMDCDIDYTTWQSRDVIFHTKVKDNKSGLKEVVYSIDGKETKKVVFKEFVKEYSYDLTATKTAEKASGYTMSVKVVNNTGTESEAHRQVYVDKEAPVVRLSGVTNGTHYNKNVTITTNVGDVSYKNTKTIYYVKRTLDGKTYTEKVSAWIMSKREEQRNQRFRKEGTYKIYAVTTDSAGNITRSNTLRFVIDKTAPKLAISGTTNGSMNAGDVSITFDLTDSYYQTADAGIRIEKKLDGATTTEEITAFPKQGKHSSMNRTFSTDGTYQITFTAKDKAGNRAVTKTISFSVDKTKPQISITGTSNYEQWDEPVAIRFAVEESYYAGNHITIRGTRTDINGKEEEIDLPKMVNSSKLSSLQQIFSEDGIYDFVISARDEAGNQDEKEIHFVLDQTSPEIHKVAEYSGGYFQEFQIADTLEEVFRDLTVVSYRILLNGVEYDGTTPVTDEGKYNLSVEVQDELGHKSTKTAEFIIDHTAPKVIFTGVKDGQAVSERGTVTLSLTNPEDEITKITMNDQEYDPDTRQLEYSEYGTYRINVDCVDKAGNKVTRTLQFNYYNPLTTTILFAIMGGLILITCIWLWMRTMKKEKEEERI
ncbi:MAG: Ig-like domain-containing protein [Clostridium sp.]|nr:Ig-like domain-containing protein [Clostridium sp.]